MEANVELVGRLTALMPGMEGAIAAIVGEYRIGREQRKDRRSLQRSVEAFLAAKRIDGLASKNPEKLPGNAGYICRKGGQACHQNHNR